MKKETFLHVKTQIYTQLLFVVAVERKISLKLDACDICVRCRYVGQKYGCRKNVDFFCVLLNTVKRVKPQHSVR